VSSVLADTSLAALNGADEDMLLSSSPPPSSKEKETPLQALPAPGQPMHAPVPLSGGKQCARGGGCLLPVPVLSLLVRLLGRGRGGRRGGAVVTSSSNELKEGIVREDHRNRRTTRERVIAEPTEGTPRMSPSCMASGEHRAIRTKGSENQFAGVAIDDPSAHPVAPVEAPASL
jgi:hypothetical protein